MLPYKQTYRDTTNRLVEKKEQQQAVAIVATTTESEPNRMQANDPKVMAPFKQP